MPLSFGWEPLEDKESCRLAGRLKLTGAVFIILTAPAHANREAIIVEPINGNGTNATCLLIPLPDQVNGLGLAAWEELESSVVLSLSVSVVSHYFVGAKYKPATSK